MDIGIEHLPHNGHHPFCVTIIDGERKLMFCYTTAYMAEAKKIELAASVAELNSDMETE